jgi:integrase/recombinase XerC
MARLRKLGKSGRYYLCFHNVRRSPAEKSVPMQTSDVRVARRRANQVEKLADRGEFNPWRYERLPWESRDSSLAAAVEAFLDAKRDTCRPKTVEVYGSTFRGLLALTPSDLPPDALNPALIKRYVLASGISDATRRHRYRNIRAFVRWAHEAELLDAEIDPLKGIRVPKPEKRLPAFLTPPDLDRLLAAIDGWTKIQADAGRARSGENLWLKDVVLVAAYTGLRLGELAAARWSWVGLDAGTITVRHSEGFRTKAGRERTVPLVGPALEAVQRLKAEREARGEVLDGVLFPGPRGKGIHPERTSKRFKHFVRVAKLDERLHFHSLRHSCGSMLALAGVPSVVIAEVLGHASTQTTAIYVHAAGHHVREAMERAFAQPSTD